MARDAKLDRLKTAHDLAFQRKQQAFQRQKEAWTLRKEAHVALERAREARQAAYEANVTSGAELESIRSLNPHPEEIQAAEARHNAVQSTFEGAKQAFYSAKDTFQRLRINHERLKKEFHDANESFNRAAAAFKERLSELEATSNKRIADRRVIAEAAGVPTQYLNNVWFTRDTSGNTNLYFGGTGHPHGPGHGRIVLDHNGMTLSRSDPHTNQTA